ncbi:hypothetical protein BDW69DRAFT_187270 [Aspergillus filifer]
MKNTIAEIMSFKYLLLQALVLFGSFAAAYAQFLGQGSDLSALQDEPPFVILCGDKKLPEQTLTEMTPVFEVFSEQSRLTGTHLILAVGNPYDIATALVSTRNISSRFQNGVLNENGGFGHTSIAHGSTCTINALRAYFKNGTLPEHETRFEVDYALFDESLNIGTPLVSLGYL